MKIPDRSPPRGMAARKKRPVRRQRSVAQSPFDARPAYSHHNRQEGGDKGGREKKRAAQASAQWRLLGQGGLTTRFHYCTPALTQL